MVDVALSSRGGRRRGALTLPVEECLIDGIVLVERCGGVIIFSFLERHEENVQLFLRQTFDTFSDVFWRELVQGHEAFISNFIGY